MQDGRHEPIGDELQVGRNVAPDHGLWTHGPIKYGPSAKWTIIERLPELKVLAEHGLCS